MPITGTFEPILGTPSLTSQAASLFLGQTRRDVLALLIGRPDERLHLREIMAEWKWEQPASGGTPVWSHNGGGGTGESYKQVVKLTFFRGAANSATRTRRASPKK